MSSTDFQIVFLVLLIVFLYLGIKGGVQKVGDGRVKIVERIGKRHRVLQPGINLVIPFIDTIKKPVSSKKVVISGGITTLIDGKKEDIWSADGDLSMAETRMDPPATTNLYTKDNTQVIVDSVAYFKVSDPFKLVYEVSAFSDSFKSIIETTLRQAVGKFTSDSIITSREALGNELREAVQQAASNWGVSVIRVEIENIEFSDKEVVDALSNARANELLRRAELVEAQAAADVKIIQSEAERKRIINEAESQKQQNILFAEGEKQKSVLLAEGEKQKTILTAEGQFEQDRLEAEAQFLKESKPLEGQAKGYIELIAALKENSTALLQLEALRSQSSIAKSLGNANTIVVPSEAAGLVGAAGVAVALLNQLKK
jgi:regulator of protease activity HflC (stomatin/prohibitin superfamily)